VHVLALLPLLSLQFSKYVLHQRCAYTQLTTPLKMHLLLLLHVASKRRKRLAQAAAVTL
jgi:hypothetical protein